MAVQDPKVLRQLLIVGVMMLVVSNIFLLGLIGLLLFLGSLLGGFFQGLFLFLEAPVILTCFVWNWLFLRQVFSLLRELRDTTRGGTRAAPT